MAHCSYEKLSPIESVLVFTRKLKDIKETKPGVFYIKQQAFLHFHMKDEVIWADVKEGKMWGERIYLPTKITKKFLQEFESEIIKRHSLAFL